MNNIFKKFVLSSLIVPSMAVLSYAADAPEVDQPAESFDKIFGNIGVSYNRIDHKDSGDDEGTSDERNIELLFGYDMGNYVIALDSLYTSRDSSDPDDNNGLRDGSQNAIRIETKPISGNTYGAYLLGYSAKDGDSESNAKTYLDGYGYGLTYTRDLYEDMYFGLVAGYMDLANIDSNNDDRLHSTTYINPSFNIDLNERITFNLNGYVLDGKEDSGASTDLIEIYGYALSLDYKLNDNLSLDLIYKYDDYDEPANDDYATEKFIGLGLSYSIGSNNPIRTKLPNHSIWSTSVDGHLD